MRTITHRTMRPLLLLLLLFVLNGPVVLAAPQRRSLQVGKDNGGKNGREPPSLSPSPSVTPTHAATTTGIPTSVSPTSVPPSPNPSVYPTTESPTMGPSQSPSITFLPTRSLAPTKEPSDAPSFSLVPTTVSPSTTPTGSPTRSTVPSPLPSAPSPNPTGVPSADPTSSPTTALPTLFPSSAPTESGIIGILNLRLSLYRPGLEALDVLLGREKALVVLVRSSIRNILCWDTNFKFFRGPNEEVNVCPDRPGRFLAESFSAIREDLAHISLEDGSEPPFDWTEWRFAYPVLSVGEQYQAMAAENGVSPLSMMQSVAQLAVNLRIKSGDLSRWLDAQTSVVGEEVPSWAVTEAEEESPYLIPLRPSPLHGLRISGIVLFTVTLLLGFCLSRLSTKRRKEREWDKEFRNRRRGGLGTEEGLDYMLEVGRRESLRVQDHPQHEEECTLDGTNGGSSPDGANDGAFPLPGYMPSYSPPSSPESDFSSPKQTIRFDTP